MPGTLVRYGAYGAKRMRYANMAVGAYRVAYANRGKVSKAARTIGRAWRRSRKASRKRKTWSRQHIGERVGTSTSKRDNIREIGLRSLNSRTLDVTNLTDNLSKATGLNEVNARQRQIVNLRGIKFCFTHQNREPTPYVLHYAVLNPKGDQSGVGTTDFFRGHENERAQNFANVLTGLQFECLSINTDRFNVVLHKRIRLVPDSSGFGFVTNSGNNWGSYHKYIPIKRQIRYNTTGQTIDGSLYLVIWCDSILTATGTTPVSNAMQIAEHHVMYFKEPKA